jgi:hypothetical protein
MKNKRAKRVPVIALSAIQIPANAIQVTVQVARHINRQPRLANSLQLLWMMAA